MFRPQNDMQSSSAASGRSRYSENILPHRDTVTWTSPDVPGAYSEHIEYSDNDPNSITWTYATGDCSVGRGLDNHYVRFRGCFGDDTVPDRSRMESDVSDIHTGHESQIQPRPDLLEELIIDSLAIRDAYPEHRISALDHLTERGNHMLEVTGDRSYMYASMSRSWQQSPISSLSGSISSGEDALSDISSVSEGELSCVDHDSEESNIDGTELEGARVYNCMKRVIGAIMRWFA